MEFQGQHYVLNQAEEDLWQFIHESKPGEYTRYYDKFVFNTGRCARQLWAHDEQKQIDKMRELYDLVPEKPEWLTREQIDAYAAQMGAK